MSSVPFTLPTERYRPNVGILLLNKNDELLICERIEKNGAWQFPQGGVDAGEDFITALHREVWEEIGLEPTDYEMLDQRGGYKYKYPPGVREKKKRKHNCVGQEQAYYLCKLNDGVDQNKVDVNQDPAEFQKAKWIRPHEFKIEWVPEFKKEVFKKVFRDFFQYDL